MSEESLYRARVSRGLCPKALDFVSSLRDDERILVDDILGTLAHVLGLKEAGVLTERECRKICRVLGGLLKQARSGELRLEGPYEDVHEFLENEVIKRVGIEIGGKIHSGRSRNDQVALAIRLRVRKELLKTCDLLLKTSEEFLHRAEGCVELPIPFYTHTQQAQIGSLGHYFLSKFDDLLEDYDRLVDCFKRVNLSPLGACAVAGTGLPIKREMAVKLLGFSGLVENSLSAVSSRGFMLEVASCLNILMSDLSRIAEDLILWSSNEFGFVTPSDEYASTSSVMPQKVNPCTLELMRARAAEVQGLCMGLFSILKGLVTGYNRDLQETKPILWKIFDLTQDSLAVLKGVISTLKINEERCLSVSRGSYALALDLAEGLVLEYGVPFRLAHRVIGQAVRKCAEEGRKLTELSVQELEEISEKAGQKLKLRPDFIKKYAEPLASLRFRKTRGSPNPAEARRMLLKRRGELKKRRRSLDEVQNKIDKSISELLRKAGVR